MPHPPHQVSSVAKKKQLFLILYSLLNCSFGEYRQNALKFSYFPEYRGSHVRRFRYRRPNNATFCEELKNETRT